MIHQSKLADESSSPSDNRSSALLASGITSQFSRNRFCREALVPVLAVKELREFFHLEKYDCPIHGSNLEVLLREEEEEEDEEQANTS